ncbi:hypothetical protein ACRE_031180 [Hapsidospora chrysogenum ATCC 11550]|uniref:Peroxisomal membrane protein-like protein n=1 Tax=Hapsidospora chrysogenum (strain ATCC 11550 / CBS 779.69 / DSM 880 / IAM 14645 / JCM 23072 / IMI 49137) TaxID=857340 RepID=A0A086T9T7_HAPC1|nr:hypothetical protein ACRE_031180 [Hapsidospora chrysogenum ATCC 11550]
MAGTYDQFIAFGTDNAGLERILRLFQSLFQILTSYPLLIATLLPTSPPAIHISAETSLRQLQSRLAITRRWLRLFRFLDAFRGGWQLYLSEAKTLETWLDAHAKTCLGMYGLLESVTLLDLLDVDHLEVFGRERAASLNVDAQRFWFAALYLSAMSSAVKLVRLLAYRPVPPTGDGFAMGGAGLGGKGSGEKDGALVSGEDKSDLEKIKEEREKRKRQQKEWAKKVSGEMGALGMKLLSDMLDLVIPASIVGWIQVDPGLVGLAMFCSTIITGNDVWRRHGRQLAKEQA